MSTHEYAYGEFFLAIDLEGRTFHYVVESVDGRIDLGSNRVESWLVVGPDGAVRVLDEPVNRTQELRDAQNGGPSWFASPFHAASGVGRPLVMSFMTNGMPSEYASAFEQVGFREGQPAGYRLVNDGQGRFRGERAPVD
jgi:hypothetical protein